MTLDKALFITATQEKIAATTAYQTKNGENINADFTFTYPVAEPDEEING